MKVIKQGEQRLIETDAETAAVVTRMLLELERDGMDAVRRYSLQFDDWTPASFRLSEPQIANAIALVPEQTIRDTDYCQGYTGGVWVGKFLKTCAYQRMTPQASVEVAEVTERQCLLENMLAHAITARVRIERYGAASIEATAKLAQERTSH